MEQLGRADAFIITKGDQITQDRAEAIAAKLRQYNPAAPVAMAIHKPSSCLAFAAWHDGKDHGSGALQPDGQSVLAVSALGNPASFERTLADAGFTVAALSAMKTITITAATISATWPPGRRNGLPFGDDGKGRRQTAGAADQGIRPAAVRLEHYY
mgnify:CR=1 FL=1